MKLNATVKEKTHAEKIGFVDLRRNRPMIQAKIVKGDRVIAHSIANTKPEAEAELLYQLMKSFDVSIRFEYPDNNPTKEKLK